MRNMPIPVSVWNDLIEIEPGAPKNRGPLASRWGSDALIDELVGAGHLMEQGGRVTRTKSSVDAVALWEALPEDGSSIGNMRARASSVGPAIDGTRPPNVSCWRQERLRRAGVAEGLSGAWCQKSRERRRLLLTRRCSQQPPRTWSDPADMRRCVPRADKARRPSARNSTRRSGASPTTCAAASTAGTSRATSSACSSTASSPRT